MGRAYLDAADGTRPPLPVANLAGCVLLPGPDPSDPSDAPPPLPGPWQVVVVTSDKFGAGTDANVFIDIHGMAPGASTGRMVLDNKGVNDFERGQTNTFTVSARRHASLVCLCVCARVCTCARVRYLHGEWVGRQGGGPSCA